MFSPYLNDRLILWIYSICWCFTGYLDVSQNNLATHIMLFCGRYRLAALLAIKNSEGYSAVNIK